MTADNKLETFAFAVNTLRKEFEEKNDELERIKGHYGAYSHFSSQFSLRSIGTVRHGSAFDMDMLVSYRTILSNISKLISFSTPTKRCRRKKIKILTITKTATATYSS